MYKEWSVKKVSLEDTERKYLKKIERLGPDSVPFGYLSKEWLALKAQIQLEMNCGNS